MFEMLMPNLTTGFKHRVFFIPRLTTLKTTREKSQIFIQHFFKIVLYWCLGLIRHNIGIPLKHNKYIFDIPIPFCHHLYLSTSQNLQATSLASM